MSDRRSDPERNWDAWLDWLLELFGLIAVAAVATGVTVSMVAAALLVMEWSRMIISSQVRAFFP